MRFLVISGNPKAKGLCFSVMEQVIQGAEAAGATVEVLEVNSLEKCRVCGEGWGTCRTENRCSFGELGFDGAQQCVKEADLICLITPVYWGEMAEGLKSFLDKLRRCEFGQNGALSKKPVLLIASPGGTGNGLLSCLEQMDRFCRHTGAVIFDYIGINRWNHDYKKAAVFEAARAMASGRIAGEDWEK